MKIYFLFLCISFSYEFCLVAYNLTMSIPLSSKHPLAANCFMVLLKALTIWIHVLFFFKKLIFSSIVAFHFCVLYLVKALVTIIRSSNEFTMFANYVKSYKIFQPFEICDSLIGLWQICIVGSNDCSLSWSLIAQGTFGVLFCSSSYKSKWISQSLDRKKCQL